LSRRPAARPTRPGRTARGGRGGGVRGRPRDSVGVRRAVETRILYGTDVVEAIRDAAREVDATAVAFVPRGGSRILDVLTGDIRNRLLIESDRPVVALPDGSTGTGADGEEG